MKLLVYSSYFYPYISGITVYTKRVFAELSKKYSVNLLTFKYDKNLEVIEDIQNIQIMRMPYLFKLSKGFISPQSIFVFFKEVRRNDIIFLNIPNVEALPLAVLAKLFRKKLIAIFYCEVVLGNSIFEKIVQAILNFSVLLQLSLSDEIIMLPGYEKQSIFARFFENKIKFISPPIKKLPINQDKLVEFKKLKRNDLWIGFVGRLSREKGIEYLIEAVEILSKDIKNLKIVIAGPSGKNVAGEEKYETKVKQILEEKKVEYIFLGLLTEEELGALYESLNVLVLPSINKTEAFGMVQVEAMLHGVPVVATNLPGINGAVNSTKMGELFLAKNSKDLYIKLEMVLSNKTKYEKNLSLVMKSYNFHDTINSYEELLKSIS